MCFLRTHCLRHCASFHKTAHSQMTHEKSVMDQPPKSHCRLCPRNVPKFGMAFTNRSKLCPGNNCWLDYALQEKCVLSSYVSLRPLLSTWPGILCRVNKAPSYLSSCITLHPNKRAAYQSAAQLVWAGNVIPSRRGIVTPIGSSGKYSGVCPVYTLWWHPPTPLRLCLTSSIFSFLNQNTTTICQSQKVPQHPEGSS